MSGLSFRKLTLIKARTLLHDPPNKSWLIKRFGSSFSAAHESEARSFRLSVLNGTSLNFALTDEEEAIVRDVDRVSSTIERWVLRGSSWPTGSYVYYSTLHNIMDPKLYREITKEPNEENIKSLATNLNKILVDVEKLIKDQGIDPHNSTITYNTLYALYEVMWYSTGLPPALADTRTPTHTIFDHLYASSSMVNLLTSKDRPNGYYVFIDFPGIQKFVGTSRKAGDFWASSWLLSNTIWETITSITMEYGFDTLLIPTPRLNPYTLRTILAWITSKNSSVELTFEFNPNQLKDVLKKIYHTYNNLYATQPNVDVMWIQPIIPATASMVLPPIAGCEDDLFNKIVNAYRNAWNSITSTITDKLDLQKTPSKLAYHYIKSAHSIISEPPQGLSIALVRVDKVYEALVKCLKEGDKDVCEELGLNPKTELIKSYAADSNLLDELPKLLLHHVLTTRGLKLVKTSAAYGKFLTSTPRPFWTTAEPPVNNLTSVNPLITKSWVPCSMCGDEPAILNLKRELKTAKAGETLESFRDDVYNEIWKVTGVDLRKDSGKHSEFLIMFKPGEVLGPYCLIKRATYMAFTSAKTNFSVPSTDDIAWVRFSTALNTLGEEVLSEFIKGVAKELSKQLGVNELEALEVVTTLYSVDKSIRKDFYALASRLTNYEKFVKALDKAQKAAALELTKSKAIKIVDFPAKLFSVEDDLRDVMKLLTDPCKISVERIVNKCFAVRRSVAIIRGDADNMGKILNGVLVAAESIEKYVDEIYRNISTKGEVYGKREEALLALRKGYDKAKDLIKALGIGESNILVTPALSNAISSSLISTIVEDLRAVHSMDGVLIYSGGDDVCALTPTETSVRAVELLRTNFVRNGFRSLEGAIIPTIPTGRKFSVRYINMADFLADELAKTLDILEEGEKINWYLVNGSGPNKHWKKDFLIISDSRVENVAKLTLHPSVGIIPQILKLLNLYLTCGVISGNVPEDVSKLTISGIERDALKTLLTYAVKRNYLIECEEPLKKLEEIMNKLFNVTLEGPSMSSNLSIEVFVNALKILRRYP